MTSIFLAQGSMAAKDDAGADVGVGDLLRVLGEVHPTEFERRPLPGSDLGPKFSSRFETGIDCDFVFRDFILVGNL